MDPVTGTAVALAGAGVQGWWAGQNQRAANDWNEYAMQRRHQWEVSDLKAAGLNPILSAGGTPGGISGAAPAPVPDLNNALSSAMQRELAEEQVEATKAETKQKFSLAALYDEQKKKTRLEQDNVATQNYLMMRQAENYDFINPELASRVALNEAETSYKIADTKRVPFTIEGLKAAAFRDRTAGVQSMALNMNTAKQFEILLEELRKLKDENVGRDLDAEFYRSEPGKVTRALDRMMNFFGLVGSARDAASEGGSNARRRR